jgi:hypothetical protein
MPQLTQAQQRVIDLMRETGQPLVRRKYRTTESGDVDTWNVDGQSINRRTALALVPHLRGGGREIEAFGHVQVRRYTLPESEV